MVQSLIWVKRCIILIIPFQEQLLYKIQSETDFHCSAQVGDCAPRKNLRQRFRWCKRAHLYHKQKPKLYSIPKLTIEPQIQWSKLFISRS